MILELAQQINVPDPSVSPDLVRQAKDFLLAIHVQSWLFPALLVGAWLFIWSRVGGIGKLILLIPPALLVIGWDSERGVLKAAAGSQSDSVMLTILFVGGLVAILKFARMTRPARAPKMPRHGLLRRGR